jgi:hypothetical protein
MEHAERLRGMHAAFNARDIDLLLEQLTPDVDWPNAWKGAGFMAMRRSATTGVGSGP